MKYAHVYTFFLMLVFHTSCGQKQTEVKSNNTNSETKDTVTSQVPNSMVRNIKQARNGDILIASYKGVFRYDVRLNDSVGQGKSFTNITSTIKSPSFWDVLEDRKGNLWFGTRDSGVYYYNGKSFQHFTTKDGLASNTAIHIYEDKAGNIWFGASRYDARLNDGVGQGKSFRNFTTKDGFPSNSIRLLLEDKTGKLWFGGHGENMFVYDARPDSIGRKTFTVLKNNDGKAFHDVWSIIEDKKGNIWFGADGGLWRYDPSTTLTAGDGTFTKVSQRMAYAIIEDKKGNIWTSSGNSILCYDEQSLSNINPTVKEIKVPGENTFLLGILEANDGSIWVGAMGHGRGVYRYDGKTITDFKTAAGQQ